MAYLHLHRQTQTQIPTRFWTPNPMATLHSTEAVPIAQTQDLDSDPDLEPQTLLSKFFGTDIRVRVRQCK